MRRDPFSEAAQCRGRAREHGGARRASVALGPALLLAYLIVAGGCSSSGAQRTAGAATTQQHSTSSTASAPPAPAPKPPPHLLVNAPRRLTARWSTVARVHGRPAAWVARRSGVTLMRFDQSLVHVTLHAGSTDGGAAGWTYGDHITPREIHLVIAAINGGFKLTYADVGFSSGGRVAVAIKSALASIVTYTDGTSDVGAWRAGVPSAEKTVFSVLQNQRLLVDRGVAAANVSSCIIACWGETIGSRTVVARAGLGITSDHQLVWAAGEELTPADLAAGLIGAGAVRALELDINPDWVAGYLYVHRHDGPAAVPVVPGQTGIAGQLLEPSSRDFLAFVAN